MPRVQLLARANVNDEYHDSLDIVDVAAETGQMLVENGRARWVTGGELDTPEGSAPLTKARQQRGGRKETR